jgi:hypothetical protein
MIKRGFILLLFCVLFAIPLGAQTIITGVLTDESGKPTPNISLVVYPLKSRTIIAFGFSDQSGTFSIHIHSETDSLLLEVKSLQFAHQKIILPNKSREIKLKLTEEVKDLEEIVVRARTVEKRGDTLSYLVSGYVREQDRSLEDVLKKIPGMYIESSGRILYQGNPIHSFYVEGLDLMEGRYSLISRNLTPFCRFSTNHRKSSAPENTGGSYALL